jgi:hypothetical protein
MARRVETVTRKKIVIDRIDLVKKGAKVLWLYRGEVETGDVQFLSNGHAALIWLEGYKSRNDDVKHEELLAVWDPNGPDEAIFPFKGRGHLLPAGRAWLEKNPNPA